MYKLEFEKFLKDQIQNYDHNTRFKTKKQAEGFILEKWGSSALSRNLGGYNINIVADNKEDWINNSVPRIRKAVEDLKRFKKRS